MLFDTNQNLVLLFRFQAKNIPDKQNQYVLLTLTVRIKKELFFFRRAKRENIITNFNQLERYTTKSSILEIANGLPIFQL